ncbi:MAG: integrase core domain-containing protein [Gemmatimonadaceae bacterium]
MSEKLDFALACLDRSVSILERCRQFGISEKTGHKILKRFEEGGLHGLEERSRARLNQPHRITVEVASEIITIRRRYPHYGPQMIRDILLQREPNKHWPAASSIGELLKRQNLIRPKKKRYSLAHTSLDTGRARAYEPNLVWTADFKGQFRLGGTGSYCYPLTIMDLQTRYLLKCTALESTVVATSEKVFLRLFQERGLPRVIRTDNGVPFCQPTGLGRLGRLGFWWVRLGIKPEHNKPATPSENGAHERFHKTLKDAAIMPASRSIQAQQRRFDAFQEEYNERRPHRSLPERRPPGTFYTSSIREYPKRLPGLEYPPDYHVRLVASTGSFKWKDKPLHLSKNLAGQYVGICESEDGLVVSYGSLQLGLIEPYPIRFVPRLQWTGSI